MRVLQLGKFFPIRGGVEKVMYDLMLGLSSREIYCDMLCASTEDYPETEIQINPFAKLMVMPTNIKVAATMLAPKMIFKLRKIAHNYQIIHIHHPDPMACLALRLAGYKGKVVLHWHSDILKQKRLLQLYKPLQDWLINRANVIVGTSPIYVQESPFLKLHQGKIDFIPIGVLPLKPDDEKVAQIKSTYTGKKIVFSLGRMVEYKGYRYLIDAIKKTDDSFYFLIGGKGPLLGEIENQIKALGIGHRIKLLGFIDDDLIPNYFAAADIFCLSSILKTEAFAIVQIEAMSLGIPLISTQIPESGVSWVNQNNVSGITVPIEDSGAIADAIHKLGHNPIYYNKIKSGAFARYKDNFTLDKMIDKTVEIYQKLTK